MLTLQQFKSYISMIQYTQESIDKQIDVYSSMFEDFVGVPKYLANVEDKLIDWLEQELDAKDWISWYVYDTVYGTVPLEVVIDSVSYIVDSDEVIYNILVQLGEK